MKGLGVSHDVSPYPQLNTTMTHCVGGCGEPATRTCDLPSAPRLLNTHDENHRLIELVSEIDAPPGQGRRTSSRSSTALGGKQRADIGGGEGKLHNLQTVSARPKRPLPFPPETNWNDFGCFLELISRFKFEFCRRGKYFLNDSNFRCVQSSTTSNVAVHVPVLWPVCAHAIPFRMLWLP